MSNLMVENQTEQVSMFLEDVIHLITNYVIIIRCLLY